MNNEQVYQLLTEMNPVPDPDALDSPVALAELEQRSPSMATEERIETGSPRSQPRNGGRWPRALLAAAAAVVALIVAVGAAAVLRPDREVAVAPEVSVVIGYYDAWNSGDFEAWAATQGETKFFRFLVDPPAGEEPSFQDDIFFDAGLRANVVEPCRLVPTTARHVALFEESEDLQLDLDQALAEGSVVECTVVLSDKWLEPAGVGFGTVTEVFIVSPERTIVAFTEDSQSTDANDGARVFQYHRAFWRWLQDAHPEVYAEIEPFDGESFPGWMGDATDMVTAVEYVEEFLAQSDLYPLSG